MKTSVTRRDSCGGLFYCILLIAWLCASLVPAAQAESAERRNSAQAQFDRAEKQRAALNAKPAAERSLEEYKQTVSSYRRVYLITSHAKDVPAAILAVAQLDSEMGQRFGSKYYQAAVDTYGYLLKQYPTSRYREEALLAIASIRKNNLGQSQLAKETFEQFLKAHPRSAHKRDALEALAELAMARDLGVPARHEEKGAVTTREEKTTVVPVAAPVADPVAGQGSHRGSGSKAQKAGATPPGKDESPRVTGVTTFNGQDKAQVVIALDRSVQFYSSRLGKPERIFFDLHPARLARGISAIVPETGSGLVKTIRMAQNQNGVVRIVFEVQGAKEYTAALFDSPARLVIDLWGRGASATAKKKADRKNQPDKSSSASSAPPAANQSAVNQAPVTQAAKNAAPNAREKKTADKKNGNEKPATASATPPVGNQKAKLDTERSDKENIDKKIQSDKSASASSPAPVQAPPISAQPASIQPTAGQPSTAQPVAAQPAKADSPVEEGIAGARNNRSRSSPAERMVPPPAPEPTRTGKPSLTRALGLKVGRIVIDAGHGGHDTGTIGATGLMEKDLCLDIALRLGKMIQQRLPGAEVIYTRENDAFVALEDRTAIANQARADLFLSIHANSSQDHHARGVETYYLNLTNSPEAMAVASRENAFARGGVHDLQDIVSKIARNEKLGESREFAEDVQVSLTKRMQRLSGTTKNRGVRKAPFVVLIGADMPSILAEISFLSNPSEEQLLKRPDNRQRVAEGLYQGVANYLQSVNSLSLNLPGRTPGNRSALLEQSGNQR